MRLHDVRAAARSADGPTQQDVVDVEEICGPLFADRRGVRVDPGVELRARALLQALHLVALVAVDHENGEQPADVRSHGGRSSEIEPLRLSLLGEHGDVMAASAPLARELPGVDVRPRATQEVAVPDEDPQLVRPLVPRGEVEGLLLREHVDLDAHRLELQPGDLLVDVLRDVVDPPLERRGIPDDPLGRERLVREGHVHDERRMALGRREVHEPPLADEVDAPAVRHRELVDERACLARLDREVAERADLDLDVEVARVGEDRAVLHPLHVRAGDDVLVAGRRAEEVADRGRGLHREHLVAVHRRLERAHRIDLGDDDVRTHSAGSHRDAAARPAVAGDDEPLAGEEDVRRADDPVDRRLAGAVAVVEEVLRARLVDRDDREAELAVALERLQANDARRRLLRARDHVAELLATRRVEDADDVGAVVHREVRTMVDRRLDVAVVRVVVLALDREHADAVLLDERGRDVVLRRERVGRAEDDVRAARLQRAGEVRRLGRHVQARGDAVPGERLLALEALADRREHRHLPVGPRDPAHAFGGERQILHVVSQCRCHRSSLRCRRGSGRVGREQALVLALLPLDPGRGDLVGAGDGRPGEPRLDRRREAPARGAAAARTRAPASSTSKRARSSASAFSWFSSRMP